jgi:hypothetical protein
MAILTAQRDFSSGELNVDAKRRDDQPIMRAGARQLRNWRVLNSGAAINRAGRRALFSGANRVEPILVKPGTLFYLAFGAGFISIFDASGNLVTGNSNAYAWTAATVKQIVLAVVPTSAAQRDVVMTFDGQQPKVATWIDGVGWSFGDFNFGANTDGSKQLPFYRLSTPGVTLQPSNYAGNITIQASSGVFVAGMVGTIIRFLGRQILLTQWNSGQNMSGSVMQQLFPTQSYTATAGFIGSFAVGDILADSAGNEGEVYAITTSGGSITSVVVNMMSAFIWPTNTGVYGPGGSFVVTGGALAPSPGSSVQWDEAVFSTYRGWPRSCFFDQNRLGFCDVPSLPSGIAWSGIGLFTDFYVGANPSDPIFELAPERARVYHVATKQDEMILTDRGIWYIPISESNPLKPGSVIFKKISVDAASQIKPSETNEGVVFISAGFNRIVAIVPTGSVTTSHAWQTKETSLFHQHLFNAPFAIASTTGDDTFSERYVYVLNGDGTIAVGKYDAGKEWVGWLPWQGKGTPLWISVLGSITMFVTQYGSTSIAETLDPTLYLDGAVPVNSPPVGLAPPVGLGPLWWLANGSVDLMDGVQPKGTYNIDANGNIVPIDPGEDLSSATLMAGQSWTSTLEPFTTNADAGADQHQRTRRRRVMRVAATVEGSTGFKFSKLYSGPKGTLLPTYGSEIGSRRIAVYNQDDDQRLAPPTRHQTYTWRPTGREFDPRIAIVKDVPGPLTVVEVAMELTT